MVPDDAEVDRPGIQTRLLRGRRTTGVKTMSDEQALDAIWKIMSGAEWNADTLDEVAEIMRQNGRACEDITPDRESNL
jgi:hypothetical protein